MLFHHAKLGGYGESRFSGVQIVPPSLVSVARGLFATQGIGADAVNDSGEIDPQALIALAFDKMLIQTAVTPDIEVDLKAAPDPSTAALLNEFKPRITLYGRAGKVEIAPYGMDMGSTGWPSGLKIGLGVAVGFLGVLILGKALL